MRMLFLVAFASSVLCILAAPALAVKKGEQSGEALFMTHCTVCHPGGGNIVNPAKTLHKKTREANKIKTAKDIMQTMRKPGPGMTPFDEKTIPDSDAKAIAEYILKSF